MNWRTTVALVVSLVLIGFAFGACWRDNAHAGWEAEREAVLARADSVRAVADSLASETARLALRHDSLAREARRHQQRADANGQRASTLHRELVAYRDSVVSAGDTMVPVVVLETALVALDASRQEVASLRLVNQSLAADTATLAAAARLNAQRATRWEGRAEELEQTLSGYRAKPRPKLLGFLPAPSPTLAFIAGAAIGVVVTR